MSAQLIPGLPDDLARECLMRIPPESFPAVTSVSDNWKKELRSSLFHRLRKAAGLTKQFIALVLFGFPSFPSKAKPGVPTCYFAIFDPATATCLTLVPFPDLHLRLPHAARIVTIGRELVAIGGWDPQTWTHSDRVHIYDFATGTWRQGACMPGPRRSCFACAASAEAGLVFVAGGHDGNERPLRSALSYDVKADEWFPLPDMAMEHAYYRGTFSHGAFHAISGTQPTEASDGEFLPNLEAFNVGLWRWEVIEDETLKAAMAEGAEEPQAKGGTIEWREMKVPTEVAWSCHVLACCSIEI